jgi:predicted dehydrogenase
VQLHGAGYTAASGIELVGFTDRERNYEHKTVLTARKFGVKSYLNIDEMLKDESIDALDIRVGAEPLRDSHGGAGGRQARAV